MDSADVFEAISSGDLDRLKALVATDAAAAVARDGQGVSALMMTLYHRRSDMADLLLQSGLELDVFEAAALGRVKRVSQLIDADSTLVNAWSPDGFSTVHLSAFFAQAETAQLLVTRGANVAAVAKNDMMVQPLHSAAAGGSVEVVTLLLDAGAPVNAKQHAGFTALQSAAVGNMLDMARVLLDHGADPQLCADDGKDAVAMALSKGHDEMVTLLSER